MPNNGQLKGCSEISRENIIEFINKQNHVRFDEEAVVITVVAVVDVDDVKVVLQVRNGFQSENFFRFHSRSTPS